MSPTTLVALAMLAPLVASLLILAVGRWPNLRSAVTIGTAPVGFIFLVLLYPHITAGGRPGFEAFELLPGLAIAFEVEPLGLLYAMVASGLWIVTAIYAVGYMKQQKEPRQTSFFFFFAIAIAAAMGIAFSRNLVTLFLFYELLTLSTFPLVTHRRNDYAMKAGRVYLGLLLFTSVCFLFVAIVWTWVVAGTVEFTPGGILAGKAEAPALAVLLGLFAFGSGKAGLMPFHRWLPRAMVAPAPVSALLHAVAVVKAGVFTILKVVIYIFGLETLQSTGISIWLMYAAAFTILTASVLAVIQTNLKARLAYSTISQLGYIVLGAAMATSASVVGAGLHIATHAFGKITLFFCAGAVYAVSHAIEIPEMDGIGRKMPFTMGAFTLASISIIGLPPMGGSWSKWWLLSGALDAHQPVFVVVLLISSLLSIAYLMPIVARAFFVKPKESGEFLTGPTYDAKAFDPSRLGFDTSGIKEAPVPVVLALCTTALGAFALFFLSDHVVALLAPIVGLK